MATRHQVSTSRLGFLIYAACCSGAYGLEDIVSVSGPGLALTLLVVVPVIYAAPLAYVCANFVASDPVAGGYYRWVRAAFGDLPGYLTAWLAWLTMFTANAAFAVNFSTYLTYLVPGLDRPARVGVSIALVWAATWLNCRGIQLVGAVTIVLTVSILAPTVVMTTLALLHGSNNPFVPFARPDRPLGSVMGDGMLIALYLFGGWEKLTVNASEVREPRRAFAVALAVVVPACAATFFLPTFAALRVTGDWTAWHEGHFAVVAERVGGAPLGVATAVGGMLSNCSLLMATLLAQSRLPMVLAQDGMFPARLAGQHPRYGTPLPALILGAAILTPLCAFPFVELTGLYSLVQILAYVLLYAALFKSRCALPTRSGAASLPAAVVAGLALPTFVLAVVVVDSRLLCAEPEKALLDLVLLASGPFTYFLFRRRHDVPAVGSR